MEITKEHANAHCYGATPWGREHYIGKFDQLTRNLVSPAEREKFLLAAKNLEQLSAEQLSALLPPADAIAIEMPKNSGVYAGC